MTSSDSSFFSSSFWAGVIWTVAGVFKFNLCSSATIAASGLLWTLAAIWGSGVGSGEGSDDGAGWAAGVGAGVGWAADAGAGVGWAAGVGAGAGWAAGEGAGVGWAAGVGVGAGVGWAAGAGAGWAGSGFGAAVEVVFLDIETSSKEGVLPPNIYLDASKLQPVVPAPPNPLDATHAAPSMSKPAAPTVAAATPLTTFLATFFKSIFVFILVVTYSVQLFFLANSSNSFSYSASDAVSLAVGVALRGSKSRGR